jgi:hypothetical protein
MRPDLTQCLRSVAIDLGMQGSQYATLVALLREAADELERPRDAGAGVCASPTTPLVYDGDGAPVVGRVCFNCED